MNVETCVCDCQDLLSTVEPSYAVTALLATLYYGIGELTADDITDITAEIAAARA